jgi:hypothetical protein
MNNLSDKFSLFLYNDSNNVRLGLAVDSKDTTEINLKKTLTQGEAALAKNIEPLFLPSEYTIANKAYNTSYYNGAEIRYLNIISPEDLSVDYTIFQDKWIIGTTKMTLRSIIDSYAATADVTNTTNTTDATDTNSAVKTTIKTKTSATVNTNANTSATIDNTNSNTTNSNSSN